MQGKLLIVSPQTVAELDYWALSHNWGEQRRAALEDELRSKYVIYPFNRWLAQAWALVTHTARRNGYTVLCADAWVAAVALANQIPLITNNWKDFRGIPELQVISVPQDVTEGSGS